jgi:Transcription elongation factor, N-terminal
MSPTRLSRQGRQELEGELERLEAERSQAADRIRQAREQGNDPTENLDLRDAIDAVGRIEGRIAELRQLLATAEPLEAISDGDGARLGSVVTVRLARARRPPTRSFRRPKLPLGEAVSRSSRRSAGPCWARALATRWWPKLRMDLSI